MKYFYLLLAVALSMLPQPSQGQIAAPLVGLVRYAGGTVYPVFGVPGNYIVGKRLFDSVDALSFSDSGGLLSRKGALLLVDENLATVASFAAGTDTPVVGIDVDFNGAVAWLPAHRTLVYWNGTLLMPVAVPEGVITGKVVSIRRAGPDTAALLTTSGRGAPQGLLQAPIEEDLISLNTGALLSRTSLPGVVGNVFRQGNAIVSVSSGQLVLTAATGTRKSVPLRANDVWFEGMSGSCLHVHAAGSGRDWLVHFSGDQPSLFELPMPQVENISSGLSQSGGIK